MKIKIPALFAVLALLPNVWRTVVAEVNAAREAASDGGATITRAELEQLAATVGIKLGEQLVGLLFEANGLTAGE